MDIKIVKIDYKWLNDRFNIEKLLKPDGGYSNPTSRPLQVHTVEKRCEREGKILYDKIENHLPGYITVKRIPSKLGKWGQDSVILDFSKFLELIMKFTNC